MTWFFFLVLILAGDSVQHMFVLQKFCVFLGSVRRNSSILWTGKKNSWSPDSMPAPWLKYECSPLEPEAFLGALLTKQEMNLYPGFHTLTHNSILSCLIPRRPPRNKCFPFCSRLHTALLKAAEWSWFSHSCSNESQPQLWGKLQALHFLLLSASWVWREGNINANFNWDISAGF